VQDREAVTGPEGSSPVCQPVLRAWRDLMAGYDERDLLLIAEFLDKVEQAIDGEIHRYRDR
jgi:hypothetical protein